MEEEEGKETPFFFFFSLWWRQAEELSLRNGGSCRDAHPGPGSGSGSGSAPGEMMGLDQGEFWGGRHGNIHHVESRGRAEKRLVDLWK